MYNRRNEAILKELSRRESVASVLHVEHIQLRGALGTARRWFKEKDRRERWGK